jgi:nicotinate-nucleotide adenylyltransferase
LRLGILGGTFDPIHLGHLRTAEEIGQELRLEKVYLIPSALPPHKTGDPVTPFHQRLAMARLAVSDSPLLEALDLEGRRTGFSYSIETLKEFHTLFSPDPELFFIIGVDAFLEIKSWKEYQNLFDYAHFVIIQRPGFQPEDLKPLLLDLGSEVKETVEPNVITLPSGKTLIFMVPTLMDISSTRVRGMVMEDKSIRFLVPESVRQFIMEKGLYSNYANAR